MTYDYSFSPYTGQAESFEWHYVQQRNTMSIHLEDYENALLEHSEKAELYAFTRTVNTLPAEYAALINRSVLKRVAQNLRNMHVSNDARISALNIYYSKFDD